MKNLFTLAIALFLGTTGMQAKEDIDFSSLFTAGTSTVSFPSGWQWLSVTYQNEDKYADKSAYDYVIVKFSKATTAVSLIAQYNPDGTTGDYGENYYTTTGSIDALDDGGMAAIALDASHKDSLNCIALQNHNDAGELTITEAYFATEEEYQEAKKEDDAKEKKLAFTGSNAEGNIELAAGAWGWASKWLDMTLDGKYKSIVFELASVTGHAKVAIQGDLVEGASVPGEIDLPASTEPVTYVYDLTQYTKLSQYAFQNLNKPDTSEAEADIAASTVVITKIYLTSKSASEVTAVKNITAAKTDDVNAPMYNLSGQKVNSNYKGVVIQNGKKFILK